MKNFSINFNFFITLVFSVRVSPDFCNKASLYLSGNFSSLYEGIVSSIISVILYKLYDQFVISNFENMFLSIAVLTRSFSLYLG